MKKIYKKLRDSPAGYCSDFLLTAGITAISAGVWLIFPPAGLIAGGVGLIALAILIAGGDGDADD